MTRRISRQSLLSAAMLSGVLFAGMGEGAYGQKTKSTHRAAVGQAAEAAIEARGERQLRQLKYSGWRKLCFQPSEAEMVCRTTITGATESGQEMLRVDLIEGGAGKAARLQIFVPPMLFLEAGVRVAIGQGEAVNVPFAWCFSNTCVAAHAVGTAFIRQMRSEQIMTLKVVDSRISTVTTSLPLDQFAAVNQGPPSLIYGRSLEVK
jgi:invasion protein IalB